VVDCRQHPTEGKSVDTIAVSLTPSQAADLVKDHVMNSAASMECIGSYANRSDSGLETIVLVFDKYFMRNESRASLTVVCENLSGITWVGSTGSGGGRGAFFNLDWGTGQELSDLVRQALAQYEAR
jgi:hypothetical protein